MAPDVTCFTFQVGEKAFYLSLESVKEVVEIAHLAPLPTAPSYIAGVTAIHGTVLPVIDLSKIYPIGMPRYTHMKVIVVDTENDPIGLLSETLLRPVPPGTHIPSDDIIEVKDFFETFRVNHVRKPL